jgi:hypothetical protein
MSGELRILRRMGSQTYPKRASAHDQHLVQFERGNSCASGRRPADDFCSVGTPSKMVLLALPARIKERGLRAGFRIDGVGACMFMPVTRGTSQAEIVGCRRPAARTWRDMIDLTADTAQRFGSQAILATAPCPLAHDAA